MPEKTMDGRRKKVFRELTTQNKVFEILKNMEFKTETEVIPIADAHGRVVSRDYEAITDSPPFDKSTMDGYAVIAEDTFEADEDSPIELKLIGRIPAGVDPKLEIRKGVTAEISTGAMIPKGANAVVMEEYCEERGERVLIYKAVTPGENVLYAGSDIMAGELILREGTILTSREIGVLCAVGYSEVEVYKKPEVAIFSTGNELMNPGLNLERGKIYDINSYSLISSLKEDGAIPVFLGIARDDEKELENMVSKAMQFDAIICSGGTSAGAGDLVYRIFDRFEPGVIVHGIAVKPGKPTIIANLSGKPAFGLPGNPTSALMIYKIFVSPVIRKMAGLGDRRDREVTARVPMRINSVTGRVEYLPVNIVHGDRGLSIYPVSGYYSGAITSLSETDGFIVIEEEKSFLEEGDFVRVKLFSEEIKPADLMIIGSHCIGIDVMAKFLKKSGIKVKSINVGSSGGISAVRRGEADIAGIHLLDESGEYNIPYLKRYKLEGKCYLVKGYLREQGIIVKKGNPLGITKVGDIIDRNATIINRNRGSGTRILFDMELKKISEKEKVDFKELISRIKGYRIEAKSHTSVAVAVASGKADAGMGIKTVADRFSLDFIPLRSEEYDFLIPKSKFKRKEIKNFMEILKSNEFGETLPSGIKVYDRTGEIIEI